MEGLKTNAELIDSLIEDINLAAKHLVNGNYVGWSGVNILMVQKLTNLKKGIVADMKNRDDTIETLKHQLREKGVEIIDIPVKNPVKDGGEDGSN